MSFAESHKGSVEHLKRNRAKYALGAIALSAIISVPGLGEKYDEIVEEAPQVAAAVVGSEALFIGGLAMVAASQRKRFTRKDMFNKNYLKNEIFDKPIEDNLLLRSGVAVNTIGAVGTTAALAIGSVNSLPNTMLPSVLALAAVDLTATAAIRYNVYKGIKDNKTDKTEITT
jgi:hypothetical protein